MSPFPDVAEEGDVAGGFAAPADPVDGEEEAAAADELYIAFVNGRKRKVERKGWDAIPSGKLACS